uniref:MHYT domain-containing protein n=1 Tax=Bionectria ochroleuca TaxID=29856 RepID=A0A8H7KEU9_BIOOC
MSPSELLGKYAGQIVPRRFNVGFVVLSYIVSLIGAGSTLELINRRTGSKGLFNNVLLGGAAVTMGGVAIWSMHFVGNKAVYFGNGEPEIQVGFSPLFTVISFFVPILVLLVAFLAIGTNNVVSWLRVSLGGFLCGSAVCGMHYLGNASIQNYTCTYKLSYVISSAIIAVIASTIALSVFFVFRSIWANVWWKRLLSALLLAGAVSGMHWCAAFGTEYTLVAIEVGAGGMSRDATVIVVICLSLGACLTIAGLAIFTARKRNQSARRAQKITLGAAFFDKEGRILVDTDGLIPSTVVTDSFIQTNDKQPFTISHPYFLWMFQATRSWPGLYSLIDGMKRRVSQKHRQVVQEVSPTKDEQGLLFRGQFCLAAVRLAERLRQELTTIGVLWDEILATGVATHADLDLQPSDQPGGPMSAKFRQRMYEKGAALRQQVGKGSLMFLVRRISNERDLERLAMAGYRFAEVEHVSGIIASRMQIKNMGVEAKLRQMAHYSNQGMEKTARLRIGFFAIRARVNTSGFDVLVKRTARSALPSISLPISTLESWQRDILKRFEGLSMLAVSEALEATKMSTGRETEFIHHIKSGIKKLRESLRDIITDDAILAPGVVHVPGGPAGMATPSLTFRIVAPIHSVVNNTDYEYIPLSLFKAHQLVQMEEGQQSFIHNVHREFQSIIGPQPAEDPRPGSADKSILSKLTKKKRLSHRPSEEWDEEQVLEGRSVRRPSSTVSSQSSSTADLCHSKERSDRLQPRSMRRKDTPKHLSAPSFGGIMVSREIAVNVEKQKHQVVVSERALEPAVITNEVSASPDIELQAKDQDKIFGIQVASTPMIGVHTGNGNHDTYVDVLFRDAVEGQWWKR